MDALPAPEAFLTIAFTAAMSSDGARGRVGAPVLAVLGLVLAVVAWPECGSRPGWYICGRTGSGR